MSSRILVAILGLQLITGLLQSAESDDWRELSIQGIQAEMSGEFTRAESLHDAAMALTRQIDPEGVESAAVLNNLARIYHSTGRLRLAEQNYLRSLRTLRQHLGEADSTTIAVLSGLVTFYADTGQFGRGDEHAGSLDTLLKASSLGPRERLLILTALGTFRLAIGKRDLAEVHMRDALELAHGSANSGGDAAALRNNYGLLLVYQGRAAEGRVELETACSEAKRLLTERHPFVHRCLLNLAIANDALGDSKTARKLVETAVHLAETYLGKNHFHTAGLMWNGARITGGSDGKRMAKHADTVLNTYSKQNALDAVIDVRSFAPQSRNKR